MSLNPSSLLFSWGPGSLHKRMMYTFVWAKSWEIQFDTKGTCFTDNHRSTKKNYYFHTSCRLISGFWSALNLRAGMGTRWQSEPRDPTPQFYCYIALTCSSVFQRGDLESWCENKPRFTVRSLWKLHMFLLPGWFLVRVCGDLHPLWGGENTTQQRHTENGNGALWPPLPFFRRQNSCFS